MKKLLVMAALLLPPVAAHAEDAVANVTAAPAQPSAEAKPAAPAEPAAKPADAKSPAVDCTNALGVSRTIEVDTAGGGEYGEQYEPKHLLEKGEVVLTFDDGPHPQYTREILAALAAQCTKATFFNVGEMIKEYPDVAREVQAAGHTVGTHTYTHRNLASLSLDRAKSQIETTINEAQKVLPEGVAPFFRFPYLSDPKRVREYLASRNIAVFGIDVDSFDWRVRSPEKVVANVTKGLEKVGGGIILMHDIHPQSAKAIPIVLAYLKEHGYKVVHLVPKSHIETVAMAEPAPEPATHRRVHRHRRVARR
jgi:peptidoglycan-N-acetylglucosamine deacetylase